MVDIRAFRGFRYDPGRVGSLTAVVCPPYDVIDPVLQERLYAASPYNAIRLELPRDEADERASKYDRAAATLRHWLVDGILRQDSARSLYVYEQEFTVEGVLYQRRGFFARVRLEPPGSGRIFPHEQTLSGPKEDRLQLYRATGFNVSPIFGLYPDQTQEVYAVLEPWTRSAPPLEARDHLGVVHRLWSVSDSVTISRVVGLMGSRPVYIADGHHRYETALRYRDELATAGEVPDPEHPANFTLMMLTGMSDPGLVILPTHRLIDTPQGVMAGELERYLSGYFDVVHRGHSAAAAWEYLQLDESQQVLAFGTAADGLWLVVRLRDPAVMAQLAPERSPAWRGLAVSILHRLVLERLLPTDLLGNPPRLRYVHLLEEVQGELGKGNCRLAVLVPAATIRDLVAIAGAGETMPPKSTYFYPKLLTGLVFHSLRKD
ncbi:MAG: DUF1015 domain-containing protein [Gemmataceae bacterium]|nr:DUF1015 domain-containing protein [Gemmataceae bacterium]MDW8242280.1 DUF1015 domain-containing protein [Thermogemmata sp.]